MCITNTTHMKLLFFLIIIPILTLSQSVSEFQLVSYDKILIKNYDFVGGIDSLKSDVMNYELITTNLGVNNGVSYLLNEWRSISGLDTISQMSNSRFSEKSILDFAQYESDDLKSPIILRKFGEGIECDSCSFSIFNILIEDNEIKEILENKNLKWVYSPYFQVTYSGEWVMSYICFYYKEKMKRTSAIIISLPDDK